MAAIFDLPGAQACVRTVLLFRRAPFASLGLAISALLLSPSIGLAAGHATVAMGAKRQVMKIEWSDANNARFSMPETDSGTYTLLHHGKLYVIAGGRVMPMSMMTMFSKHSQSTGVNDPVGRPTLQGPQGTETIAGITGQRYTVHWRDASGRTPRADQAIEGKQVVLTSDRRVRELSQVWDSYAAKLGHNFAGSNPAKNTVVMAKLFGGRGLLRMGQDFRLVSINDQAPGPSELALPAKKFPSNPALKMLRHAFH